MPIAFILLSIYIFIEAAMLPGIEGIFPAMIGTVMFLSSVTILIKNIRTSKSVIDVSGVNWWNILKIALALIVYVFIFEPLGYFISTFLMGVFAIYSLGLRDIKKAILYPLAIVLILFFAFKILLNVPLPTLFLDI